MAAVKLVGALGVSLDYLVGEGQNARFAKRTLRRLEEIEKMGERVKTQLFSVIDAVIRDYKTRMAYVD